MKFTTYTLIYSRMKWVQVEGLGQQWERAEVDAKVQGERIEATTKNVTSVRFSSPLPGPGAEAKIKQYADEVPPASAAHDALTADRQQGQATALSPLYTLKP